jgi:hypothetical protein
MRAAVGAILVAGLAACAWRDPDGKSIKADAASLADAPDSVMLRRTVQRAVEARVAANPYWKRAQRQVAKSMSLRIVPSHAVPGLRYAWGFFVPANTAHVGPFGGVVGVVADRTRILESGTDWASLVGREWSPRGPTDVIAACVEVTRFSEPWGNLYLVYSDTATRLFGMSLPSQVEEMNRRLAHPTAERSGDGTWEATYWIVHGGRSIRYRCLLRPGAPPESMIRLVPGDTADVGHLPF